jgi:hypothetical protein
MIQVVLPSFNRPRMVSRAIESVLVQTYRDFKLYVMDNSSPELRDAMTRVYTYYAEKDSRVRVDYTDVANSERWAYSWVSVVTNKAVFKLGATEEFVTFLSDDTVMFPRKLEILRKCLVRHPTEKCYAGKLNIYDKQGKVIGVLGGKDYTCAKCQLDWVQPLYKRALLEQIGPLPEPYVLQCPDMWLFGQIALRRIVMRGVDVVLDKMPSWTKRVRLNPELKAKAERGEIME